MPEGVTDVIHDIFTDYKTIAVVGLSAKPNRPSYGVAKFLQIQGYKIIPVTPTYDEVIGETAYPSLPEVPKDQVIEIVNIFRRPHHVPAIIDQAVQVGAKVVWMQLGIAHQEAAAKAREHGLQVVMNKCMKIEYERWVLNGNGVLG